MLIIISPAKTLDYTTPLSHPVSTLPIFIPEAKSLVNICQKLSPNTLASLMRISDKLAGLNAARFAEWSTDKFDTAHARPAIFAFKGDVYQGLQVEDFTDDELAFAQDHLRILSGLYGILRPLDLMQAYRLEMGTTLATPVGKDLYAFWGRKITDNLNDYFTQHTGSSTLINLASDEYFHAIQPQHLNATIIKPVFLDEKNGQYKVISFYAKKARGLMSRFVIKKQLTDVEQLKTFNDEGYAFDPQSSTATEWVFKRDATA